MADSDNLTLLNSSLVRAYRYNPDTRALRVQFPSGDIHEYDDVSAEKVETMLGNSSPGRYFNENIKARHLSKKVSP